MDNVKTSRSTPMGIPAKFLGNKSAWCVLALAVAGVLTESADAQQGIRVATMNVSLYGKNAGEVAARLTGGEDPQARRLAEIIQRVAPDVLLLNEIDYEPDGNTLEIFLSEYLTVGQSTVSEVDPAPGLKFPHVYAGPVNTGVASGYDLNRDGRVVRTPGSRSYGGDAWGFGVYEGQYGMALLSRFPIQTDAVRTFQKFRWAEMPDARLPDDPATDAPRDWYPAAALKHFRLSSKSHWDLPIEVSGRTLHVLASHPTPPVFDGPEDRNGRRNYDEIRFWADYVSAEPATDYHLDDAGRRGDLEAGALFVIVGDLNGDPHDGQGSAGISRLLASEALLDYPPPSSRGGLEQARQQGGANTDHRGDPQHDTLDAADEPGPGNLRVDYVLPSRLLQVQDAGIFWPPEDDPLSSLTGTYPFPSSDHRLVWVDLILPADE